MSLRRECPCDLDGICPYEDMHSGYFGSCEYWCGSDPEEDWRPEEEDWRPAEEDWRPEEDE